MGDIKDNEGDAIARVLKPRAKYETKGHSVGCAGIKRCPRSQEPVGVVHCNAVQTAAVQVAI